MRTAGKIILWSGIILMVLAVVLSGLAITLGAADSDEALGWALGLSFIFGLPALIISAILILIGVVVVTSTRKSAEDAASLDPAQTANLLASPATSPPRPYKNVIVGLRIVAVALFAWFFIPRATTNFTFMTTYVDVTFLFFMLMTLRDAVAAAIVPLVLWLASNLILMLTTPRDMASA